MQKSATIPHVSCHFIRVHLFLSISVFPSFPYGVQARQRVHILMGHVTRTFNDSLTGGLTVLSLTDPTREPELTFVPYVVITYSLICIPLDSEPLKNRDHILFLSESPGHLVAWNQANA